MNFSIITTSDVHGHTERFSQLAQMIKARRPALLIDNGDFIQGSHLSYFYENTNQSPHPQIQLANELQYDVAIFGNHEFNYPLDAIQTMRDACHFPWIAANIKDFAQPYFIKEIGGIRVAIVGVVTHFTTQWDEDGITKTLQFEDAFESAQKTVQVVRDTENVQLVILSYHGGFERDLLSGHPLDLEQGENQGYKMLHEIDGVDIFITGHQHLEIATKVNGVSVVQPGSNAHSFGQIDVSIENGKISHEPSLVYVDATLPQQTFTDFDCWKKEVLGKSATPLTYHDFFTPRTQATAYTALLHSMQLHYTNAQLSVIELPYHAVGGFPEIITREDVLHNLPRQNYLKVIMLTGHEIREALELSAAVFAKNANGDIDFSMNVLYPEPQPYTYDLWGGIEYEITLANPVGNRVTKLLYQGRDINSDEYFEVAVNSYRATGAHQFYMFKKPAVRETKSHIPQLMMNYIQQNSPLCVELKSKFQVK